MRITTLAAAAAFAIVSAMPAAAEDGRETDSDGKFTILAGVAATPMGDTEMLSIRGSFFIHSPHFPGFPKLNKVAVGQLIDFPATGTNTVVVGCGGPPQAGTGCGG